MKSWFLATLLLVATAFGQTSVSGTNSGSGTGSVSSSSDFLISVSPNPISVSLGSFANGTVTITSLGGFNSSVNLSAILNGPSVNLTFGFTPSSVTPSPFGTASSTLQVTAGAGTPTGTYTVKIIGTTANGVSHFYLETIQVSSVGTSNLTVIVIGSGNVSSSAPNNSINCPAACSGSFFNGANITLGETPSAGQSLISWSGVCAGSTTSCSFQIISNTTITVTFTANGTSPALPTFIDNNELICGYGSYPNCSTNPASPGLGYTAPSLTFSLTSTTPISGSIPGYCTNLATNIAGPYGATFAGLQQAILDMENCRTLAKDSHSAQQGIILVIPHGLYSIPTGQGLYIPQSSNSVASAALIVESDSDSILASMGEPICTGQITPLNASGIQDNLATSTAISLTNSDCAGGANGGFFGYQGGGSGIIANTAVSEVSTTVTVTSTLNPPLNGYVTVSSVKPTGYNGSWIVTNTSPSSFQYTAPSGLGAVTTLGTASYMNLVSLSGTFYLANDPTHLYPLTPSSYNFIQYTWNVQCAAGANTACSPVELCAPYNNGNAGSPVCVGTIGPDHWEFLDGAQSMAHGNKTGVNFFKTGGTNAPSLASFASHIHVKRNVVIGDWTTLTAGTNSMVNGYNFSGCTYCSLTGSAALQGIAPGRETHAVLAQGTLLKFVNDVFECCSSGIFTGGLAGAPPIQGFVPATDVQLGRIKETRPYQFLISDNINNGVIPAGNTTWGGQSPVFKNCGERKEGIRVLEYGGICENTDNSGGQRGISGSLTVRNTSGGGLGQNYPATINDYLAVNMIYRNTCEGLEIDGRSAGRGNGGGVSYGMTRFSGLNQLHYNASFTNPFCSSQNRNGFLITSATQTWLVPVSCNGSTTCTVGGNNTASVDANISLQGQVTKPGGNAATYTATSASVASDLTALCGPGNSVFVRGFATSSENSPNLPAAFPCTASAYLSTKITSASFSSPTVTLTVASNAGFVVGNMVTISGLAPTGCNGVYAIASLPANQITYSDTNCGAITTGTGVVSFGTVTLTNASATAQQTDTGTALEGDPVVSNVAAIGFQVFNIRAGEPGWVGSTQQTTPCLLAFPTQSVGSKIVALGIAPFTTPTGGSAAWNGTWQASNVTITIPVTGSLNTGQSDSTGNCYLTNIQGNPSYTGFKNISFFTDAISALGIGPNASNGPNFAYTNFFVDSIFTSSIGAKKAGWYNSAVNSPQEGNNTEIFDNDFNSFSTWSVMWPGRSATTYNEYGNNTNWADLNPGLPCTGTGCNPPNTLLFPANTCTAVGMNIAACGGVGSNPISIDVADYHSYTCTGSPCKAGALDGLDFGAIIPAIDSGSAAFPGGQTTTTYPGAFPD